MIVIYYNYPLIFPISKIYYNSDGFSYSEIANLICSQYSKWRKEYDMALDNNKIPKYFKPDYCKNIENNDILYKYHDIYRFSIYMKNTLPVITIHI